MPQALEIAKASDLKPGTGKTCEVGGKSVALFRTAQGFCAIDNTCCHRGGPLGEGFLEGDVVTCPWHGWEYNVTTGQCVNNPAAKVATYPVTVQGESVTIAV